MQTVIMYKYFDPDRLFGGWRWSAVRVTYQWERIESEAYYVEIPNDFSLGKTMRGQAAYFRGDDIRAYDVAGSSSYESCVPCLIGGSPVEYIRCRVIGPVPKEDAK